MLDASDRLLDLVPVSFRYKTPDERGNNPLQYGLIAEDVANVMPELVVYNAKGEPETVAYHLLPSLLLNAYKKQNSELTETKKQISTLQDELAALK